VMRLRRFFGLVACGWLSWAGTVHADAVTDWNQHAATAIISLAPTGAGKPAALGLGDLAIVHTALYDAVNAIAGSPFEPYEVLSTVVVLRASALNV
jgi:hypothetical protein